MDDSRTLSLPYVQLRAVLNEANFSKKKSKVPNTWNLYAGVPPNVFRTFATKLGPKIFDW